MKPLKKGVSFVIPARNEEQEISITIESIQKHAIGFEYEIIVVNHNSTDATASIASSMGAKVLDKYDGTIGSARNYGASKSVFDVIVFVDADVSLTLGWENEIKCSLKKLRANYLYMTGSHCVPPQDGSFLERYWFSSFSQDVVTTHLGTGHMIMSRRLFDDVGGFNEELRTGEDYDICQRAKSIGAILENNSRLLALHRDYPQNLVDFFKRERWHGKGDTQSVKAFLSSKVAVSALVHVAFHIAFLIALFFAASFLVKLFSFMCLFLVPLLAAKYKFKGIKLNVLFLNVMIFYVYFWARFLSFIR